MIKHKLDLMQGLIMDVSKRPGQVYEGEFVIKSPNGVFPIGNYIVADLLGEPAPYDTVYAPAWVKNVNQIVVMAWPLLVTFCSESEWFKVCYHIASKAQNRLMRDHLTKRDNVLSIACYDWQGHVWHAPKINGHDLGVGVVV